MRESLTIETFYSEPQELEYLSRWLFNRISIQIEPRVMEISSGSGAFAELIMERNIPLHMNNPDREARNLLKKKYIGNGLVRQIHQIDFSTADLREPEHSRIDARFATVISLDLASPQLQAKASIENMRILLQDGGLLILILRSQMALFPGIEYDLEDLRRFDIRHFSRLLSDFELLSADYFELLARPGISPVVNPGLYAVVIARKPVPASTDEAILQ